MSVWITVDPRHAPTGVPASDVLALLESKKIEILPAVYDQLVVMAAEGAPLTTAATMQVALGRAPVDATGPSLDPTAAPATIPGNDGLFRGPTLVKAGQCIARVVPASPGSDGADAFGTPIPRRAAPAAAITAGDGARIATSGATIEALIDGSARVARLTARVVPIRLVDGDLNIKTASAHEPGDLHVRGGVRDALQVRASGSIWVDQSVDSATVHADEDLFVGYSIASREKGVCSAGRHLLARNLTSAVVRAGGDVTVGCASTLSRVVCAGRFTVRGPVVGGQTTAILGVSAASIGCEAGTRTIIEVGLDQGLLEEAEKALPEVLKLRAESVKKLDEIKALQSRARSMAPKEREKLTELHYESDECLERVRTIVDPLAVRIKAAAALTPFVEFTECLHPGVVLRWPGFELSIDAILQGPGRVTVGRGKSGLSFTWPSGETRPIHSREFPNRLAEIASQFATG